MPIDPPRFLVIRRRYLGDIVLLGSFFRSLRRRWPEARIDALVEEKYAEVPPLIPEVNGTIALPSKAGPARWLSLVRTLRRNRYTHVLNLDNTEGTALLTRATGAPFRAGLYLQDQYLRFRRCYTASEAVEPGFRRTRHITEYYLRLLRTVGVEPSPGPGSIVPAETDLSWAQALPALRPRAAGTPRVLLHPGSRSAFRLWPAEQFAAVGDALQERGAAAVTLVAGPAEQEVVTNIRAAMRTEPSVIDQTLSVGRLAALIRQHELFLCHDSGPMHLAVASGVPVVALFSSQNLNEWRPLGDRSVALQPPLPCTRCVAPGVCVASDSYRNYCVRNITTEQVLAAVTRALDSLP